MSDVVVDEPRTPPAARLEIEFHEGLDPSGERVLRAMVVGEPPREPRMIKMAIDILERRLSGRRR